VKTFDETPQQWHRVERAKEMLRFAKMRVLVVAHRLRFRNAAALCPCIPRNVPWHWMEPMR